MASLINKLELIFVIGSILSKGWAIEQTFIER